MYAAIARGKYFAIKCKARKMRDNIFASTLMPSLTRSLSFSVFIFFVSSSLRFFYGSQTVLRLPRVSEFAL